MECLDLNCQSQHSPLEIKDIITSHDHHVHTANVHIPSFGTFSCDIAPVMLDVNVDWLTFEYGTEMVTPLSVVNKLRKLSPVGKRGRPELIVRVI